MRSTRNRTRSVRKAETHHYTDRTSVPVTSNAPTHDPGNCAHRPAGMFARQNTNLQLSRGGISSYYRSRERGYSG
jgi:hypothetical protein